MKRYLLFAGEDYYPNGGWNDFINDYSTIDEAKQDKMKNNNWSIEDLTKFNWAHIVDSDTGKIVWEYSYDRVTIPDGWHMYDESEK